jgi:hypothetical protein
MQLFFDHLIKVFICIVFLERRSYLLITLISLVPLPDLWDWRPSKVLISGVEIIFLPGGRLVLTEILSISFSIVFIIKLNFSSNDQDVEGCTSPWGFLPFLSKFCLIFLDTIIFTSNSITMLRTKHQYSIEKPQEKYSTP